MNELVKKQEVKRSRKHIEFKRFTKKSIEDVFLEYNKNTQNLLDKKTEREIKKQLMADYRVYFSTMVEFAQKFVDYVSKNLNKVDLFVSQLEPESINEVQTILNELDYYKDHTLIESLKYFFRENTRLFRAMEYYRSLDREKYKLPFEGFYDPSVFDYKHGLKFLPEYVLSFLENKDFIDCGAYIGDSALMFEKDYNPRKIYSFEPNPESYDYILETIKLNKLQKVIPIKKGVGKNNIKDVKFVNISQLSTVYGSECPPGVLETIKDTSITSIEITTIDKFVSENSVQVGLIKMDLEGYELEALKGAVEVIKEFKPVLLIAVYHNAEQFFGIKNYLDQIFPWYYFKVKQLFDFNPITETFLIGWYPN